MNAARLILHLPEGVYDADTEPCRDLSTIHPMSESIYVRDGEWYVPTRLAGGPWSAEAQHGGPPSALLAGAMERVEPVGMFLSRITVELLRPVGMVPHRIETEILRPGKRVQLIGARLMSKEGEVARAIALRIRTDNDIDPGPSLHAAAPANPPEAGIERSAFDGFPHFFADAIDVRYLTGGPDLAGPSTAWIRLAIPLVEGEEPSPLQRVIVAADTGNGISSELDFRQHIFINPDLTVYLHREPIGEWVLLEAETHIAAGTGVAQSALSDQQGPIGRSLQALFVDRR